MSEIIAQAVEATVIYGNKPALDKINMNVKKGEIYALVGKNGAGKTTLLRLFTGQNHPDGGHIELFGETSLSGLNKARHKTGAIIETPAFYPFFTAEKNLEYYRIQRGIKDPSVVKKVLQETGLENVGNKKFKNFSLGMKQRLGIALALMHNPEFLILDEPINGLDPSGIVEIRKLMIKLNQENGLTIIISSHILSELATMATCFGFIDHGHILKELSAKELSDIERNCVKINTNDNPEAKKALMEEFTYNVDFSENGDCLIIKEDVPTEIISKFLIEKGFSLYYLEINRSSLEDYFIELIGGNANV